MVRLFFINEKKRKKKLALNDRLQCAKRDRTHLSSHHQHNYFFLHPLGFYIFFLIIVVVFGLYHSHLGVPSCQRTVAFEKACILFNLAGVYTQIATKQDRESEKGLDMAVDNFLRAAGIFKHIHETFTNAPSVDLKPEFLEVLLSLMLAQARECLYEKLLLQIETFSIANKSHVSDSGWCRCRRIIMISLFIGTHYTYTHMYNCMYKKKSTIH